MKEGTLVGEDFNSESYSLDFKGFIREETTELIARFGVVICREEDDNLLFQMKRSLHVLVVQFLEAELMALKRGLTKAMSLRLLERITKPRCPQHGCKSNQTLRSRTHLMTPKVRKLCEQTVKHDSMIPEWDRVHCPKPRCSALMSKSELRESIEEDGVRGSCFKCRKPFCINCEVPWHSDLSCKEYKTSRSARKPTTMMWRRCRSCQHIIKVTKVPMYKITCRCGFSFCYICGAQWKLEGCSHYLHMVADALIAFLLIFILIIIWV